MNILLVEDSPTLRFAMDTYIREAGHETIIAENGEKAVQLVEQMPNIDMIVMDVEMPGLNGFETTHLIRENLAEHWIPIIFVTGKSEDSSLEEGIAVGGDDYLIKPVSKVILKAKIKALERIAKMRGQLHQLNEKLKVLSQRDSLTHLYNRRTFEEKANDAWRTATRNKQPLTILLLDIDFFKRYNDSYGHVAGDQCIIKVSKALSKRFNRVGDIVARYGGEEFIVVLPNTDRAGAQHVAEELNKVMIQLNISHKASPVHRKVTVSIGGSTLKYTTGATLQQLVNHADKALYQSKKVGRHCANVLDYENVHNVLLVDNSPASIQLFTDTLEGHCDLNVVQEIEDVRIIEHDALPELIILSVESETDITLSLYKKLKLKNQLNVAPLLIMSPLDKTILKRIGKELGANGTLTTPLDKHKLISKIDQFLGKKD